MSGLGGNKLIYNEGEDAYYIQHGADTALKKLGKQHAVKQGTMSISTGSTKTISADGEIFAVIIVETNYKVTTSATVCPYYDGEKFVNNDGGYTHVYGTISNDRNSVIFGSPSGGNLAFNYAIFYDTY